MKNKNQNTGKIKEILKKYFNREEISEFSDKTLQLLTDEEKLQPQIDIDTDLRAISDLLVTFAISKLSSQKLIEFLQELGSFTIIAGEFQSAVDIYKSILQRTKSSSKNRSVYADSLLSIGEIYSRQADWKTSFRYLKKANEVFHSLKDYYGCAKCENLIGTIYGDMGNVDKAKNHFENSLMYLKDQKSSSLKANVEVNLGILNTIMCAYDFAFTYFNRSLTYYQKLNDQKRLAEIHLNIGMIHLRKNDFKSALKEFDQCIELAVASGYLQILEFAYLNKAFVYTKIKDYLYAEKFADSALKICCRINDRLSIADIYKIKGIIHRQLANYSLSENYFLTSLRFNQELQNKLNEAETNYELAILYKEINRNAESKKLFTASLRYFKKIKAADEIKNIESHMN